MSNATVYLKDYQPPVFQITQVALTFEILSQKEVVVTNVMQLERQSPGPCILDGEDLECLEVLINHKPLASHQYQITPLGLCLLECPDALTLTVVTRLNPMLNTALSGLYASRGMLCTQCEAQGFRRITYFMDRPDVLSRFCVKIIAVKQDFPVLLSNGNLVEQGDIDEYRHYVVWEDPFLKPCYLFALVAGNLVCIRDEFLTQSNSLVDLEIYVEPGDEHLCSYAMKAIKNAMRWDELRFGLEYDLQRYMVVAVKDFNMGAMENKGLNIFNSKFVLACQNTATDDDILGIESVIGHEYFHNWTGNRVTCRDWFQLSLKEGLTIYRDQSFSADMNDPTEQRISDVSNLRRVQFPEDRGALAHAVQPKSYQEINNFYTATVYEKGGEIVRMYETILGREGFRKGMDLYFQRHDGQAVTIEDFLHAMEDANGVNLKQFKHWYDEVGTPIVDVNETVTNQKLHIELTQYSNPPLLIPIRFKVYLKDGQALDFPEILLLEKNKQNFYFDINHSDVVVTYLQGFSAPIILKRSLEQEQMLFMLNLEQDGFALWDLKQRLFVEIIQQAYLTQQKIVLPLPLIETVTAWIKQRTHSDLLLVQLCSIPSFEECLVGLSEVDPITLYRCRDQFESLFANALFKEVSFQAPDKTEARGERAWRNLCWYYRMKIDALDLAPKAYDYFKQALNMTDRIGALQALFHEPNSHECLDALQDFYQDWQHDELVMDKWFALQAKYLPFSSIVSLIEHPNFHWKNPNKVRALIGSFTQNTLAFHDDEGCGYQWLAEVILILDAINPQVASRMVTPFTRWEWLDLKRQTMMLEQVKFLAKHKLSANVSEMVTKALGKVEI